MKKKKKLTHSERKKAKETLLNFMNSLDDTFEDTPDGAYQAILENAVEVFNRDNGTNFDPNDTFIEYIKKYFTKVK